MGSDEGLDPVDSISHCELGSLVATAPPQSIEIQEVDDY